MSTVSSAFPPNGDTLTHKNGLSDADRLKRRREARNRMILASGSDRLNRIIGLTSSNDSSLDCGAVDLKENEKEVQPSVNSTGINSSDSAKVIFERESKNEDIFKEINPGSAIKGGAAKVLGRQQEATPCFPVIDSDSFSRSGNPLIDAFLKTRSEDRSEVSATDEPSQSQTQQDFVLNEIIESVLPRFLAQPSANAFLTSKDGEPAAPRSARGNSRTSIWSPDGRIGSFIRLAILATLVLALLTLGAILKANSDWEIYEFEDGTLMELPLLGALKPYHLLLSVEIALQTHRYIFLQGARRSAPQGVPSSVMRIYELFKFYSASWTSLVDDVCLVVFLLGLWTLFESLI